MQLRFILSMMLFTLSGIADAQWNQTGVDLHYGHGYLWPHRQNMKHLPQGRAHFGEVRVYRITDGSKSWHSLYTNAEFGVTVRVFDLTNPKVLGYGIGSAFYLSAPLVHSNRLRWYLEMGAGPGFITKMFDEDDNFKNIAIGSHGNAFITLGQRLSYRFNEQWRVDATMALNHFSNAAFSLPNLGLNYPTVSLGLGYQFSKEVSESILTPDVPSRIEHFWSAGLNTGMREYSRPFGVPAPIFSGYCDYNRSLGYRSSLSAGLDVMYNVARLKSRQANGLETNLLLMTQLGARLGYNLHVERMIISFQTGAYVLGHYPEEVAIYSRVAMRYFFVEHFGVNVSLKTHLFKADYAEFGLAYRF